MIGLLGFMALWALGWALSWPGRRLWGLSLMWWLICVAASWPQLGTPVQLALPARPELAKAIGGDFRFWLLAGPLCALLLGYRALLARIRSRAPKVVAAPTVPGAFSPAELSRYSRHILLHEIGGPGQGRLRQAKVLVVGAGGLGAPALLYLAGSGVGTIGVIDDDLVENSNLQRQIIHTDARLGTAKVFSAELAMKALNPFVEVRPYHRKLDADVASALIADYDLVLDGTDNFDTRFLVNRVCAALGKPLISGAISQWEGQLSLYDPARGAPCFECVFPERPSPGMVPSCAEAGVAAPLPGVIGAMMAMEAVKQLTGAGETLAGRLLIHDALYGHSRIIKIRRRKDCAACGSL